MSRTRPSTPTKYTPDQERRDRETLADAIVEKINREKISVPDIARYYSSIRAADIASLMRGDHTFGAKRLYAIAEAIGIRARLVVSA